MAKKSERVTRAELSRQIKKSRSYISQLVKKGVFKVGKDRKVDLKNSLQDYKNFVDPNYTDDNSSDKASNGFANSRASKEHFAAEMARLDYQERKGELVSKAIVDKQQFQAARACRDAFLSIPGRLSPELAGLDSRKQIERILETAILEALERLSAE